MLKRDLFNFLFCMYLYWFVFEFWSKLRSHIWEDYVPLENNKSIIDMMVFMKDVLAAFVWSNNTAWLLFNLLIGFCFAIYNKLLWVHHAAPDTVYLREGKTIFEHLFVYEIFGYAIVITMSFSLHPHFEELCVSRVALGMLQKSFPAMEKEYCESTLLVKILSLLFTIFYIIKPLVEFLTTYVYIILDPNERTRVSFWLLLSLSVFIASGLFFAICLGFIYFLT